MLKKCRICQKNNLQKIAEFEEMPIFLWPHKTDLKEKETRELISYLCNDCGHVQLQELSMEFLELLYSKPYLNLNSESINVERLDIISRVVNLEEIQDVCDVGGATNPSYKLLPNKKYTIIDPIAPVDFVGTHIKGFISEVELSESSFDLIFAFHIVEHLENPLEDLNKLFLSLRTRGKIVVEVPNRDYYAKLLPFYLYFHQHINMFNFASLSLLLRSVGFSRLDMIDFKGRLIAVYEKRYPDELLENNEKSQIERRILDIKSEWFSKLDELIVQSISHFPKKEVVFLGAGGSTTLLLYHCPILKSLVSQILDSDERKIGFFLPGTEIPIENISQFFNHNVILICIGFDIYNSYAHLQSQSVINVLDFVNLAESKRNV